MSERHTMPVIFAGHGNPMNAIEDNSFSREWRRIGKSIERPRAILSISAHWETMGHRVTGMVKPRTIHDFYGFPQELYAVSYPAPGSPEIAEKVASLMSDTKLDQDWGLDHGSWSVLKHMFPGADIPVVQLSLDQSKSPGEQYELAKSLKELRKDGVLIFGTGNIVHNLRMINWEADGGFDWADEFNEMVKSKLATKEYDDLVDYDSLGNSARPSIPTNEHYLPLLYCLASVDPNEKTEFYNDQRIYGSLSMLGLVWQ